MPLRPPWTILVLQAACDGAHRAAAADGTPLGEYLEGLIFADLAARGWDVPAAPLAPITTVERVLTYIREAGRAVGAAEIVTALSLPRGTVDAALSRAAAQGQIVRVAPGSYMAAVEP
jgi:hypothetical protein